MTREELHNEAYEYCERRKDECIRMINYMEIAGPREKRIEELEKENEQLKAQIKKLSYAKTLLRDIYVCREDPCFHELIDEAGYYLRTALAELELEE